MTLRSIITAVAVCSAAPWAHADLTLFAAGSLRGALSEVSAAFTQKTGIAVKGEYGPSGLLREKIENGANVDVFASADMDHPRKIAASGKGLAAVRFVGNRLCAMAKPDVGLTTANFLDKALSPNIKLGTSTPHADPAGDYTWRLFDKAEQMRPGAAAALKAKALQLVGGPTSEPIPAGHSAVPYIFASGKADMFIAYCTTGKAAAQEGVKLDVVELPPALAQSADYGLTVTGKNVQAAELALFILSDPGQDILARWGFETTAHP